MGLRDSKGRFRKGVSGNPQGRPKGSRNMLSERFIEDIYAHWEMNGMSAIEKTFRDRPDVYLKIVSSLIAKEAGTTEEPQIKEVVISLAPEAIGGSCIS